MNDRRARMMAEQLEQTYESGGFTILWRQLERELSRARLWARSASKEFRAKGGGSEALGLEVAHRTGYVECLERILEIKTELLEELKNNRIPWEGRKR